MLGRPLVLGEVKGAFGVKGWVRIRSFCRPPEDIVGYDVWWIRARSEDAWVQHRVFQWQADGDGFSVRLADVGSRDEALALRGAEIAVPRAAVPPPDSGSYLWHDLIGLEVETLGGEPLGVVVGLIETGAADVLEIREPATGRTRLVPFVPNRFIEEVDLPGGRLRVDWHPDD